MALVKWLVQWTGSESVRADLVVHYGAQAHDANVDVILLTHQSGVFQRSPTRQSVRSI